MVVGQFVQETHLVVIGSAPGALHAALRAAKLGVQTMLIGPEPDCDAETWAVMAAAGEAVRRAELDGELGLNPAGPSVDLARLAAAGRTECMVRAARRRQQCEDAGIEILTGRAHFEDGRQLAVHDGPNARIRFKRAIVATGCRAVPPTGGWPDSARVTNWHGALRLDEAPGTLLILGGDSVAVELASGYAALGSNVSLVTPQPRLLAEADEDLVAPLRERLARRLEALCTATEAVRFRDLPDAVEVDFQEEGNSWRRGYDHVIVALGARPDTESLDAAKAQVQLDEAGTITVDKQQRTSNPRILAVGDVTGPPYAESRAIAQARVAADVIAGRDSVFDPVSISQVVRGEITLAWCGLTEHAAKAAGIPHKVARASRTDGRFGQAKLILQPESRLLLGVGLAGPAADEAISTAALAVEMGAVADDLAATLQPESTLGALISTAAQQE